MYSTKKVMVPLFCAMALVCGSGACLNADTGSQLPANGEDGSVAMRGGGGGRMGGDFHGGGRSDFNHGDVNRGDFNRGYDGYHGYDNNWNRNNVDRAYWNEGNWADYGDVYVPDGGVYYDNGEDDGGYYDNSSNGYDNGTDIVPNSANTPNVQNQYNYYGNPNTPSNGN